MLTLTYGYLLPENGDIGDELFDAFENNIQKMNDHNHDGVNGAKISSSNIAKLSQNILAASWVAQGNGIHRQLVNIVGGTPYDNVYIVYKDTDTNEQLQLETEKVSATSFYVYTNDNTQNITVIYI